MSWYELIINNYVLMASAFGWFSAQVIKTLIDMYFCKKFTAERLVGAGGMPSSHSATVCSLCTACAISEGLGSVTFAVTFMLAFIVMHDAMGVRRQTGKQAEFLNELSVLFEDMDGYPTLDGKLKVLVGHTFPQVIVGGIIGIIVAFVTYQFY